MNPLYHMLHTFESLERPGLSPHSHRTIGDAGSGTARADTTASVSRPTDAHTCTDCAGTGRRPKLFDGCDSYVRCWCEHGDKFDIDSGAV
jgi:hypothetical protein